MTTYFEYSLLGLFAALVTVAFILLYKSQKNTLVAFGEYVEMTIAERQKLHDRLQAGTLPQYKQWEDAEKQSDAPPPEYEMDIHDEVLLYQQRLKAGIDEAEQGNT